MNKDTPSEKILVSGPPPERPGNTVGPDDSFTSLYEQAAYFSQAGKMLPADPRWFDDQNRPFNILDPALHNGRLAEMDGLYYGLHIQNDRPWLVTIESKPYIDRRGEKINLHTAIVQMPQNQTWTITEGIAVLSDSRTGAKLEQWVTYMLLDPTLTRDDEPTYTEQWRLDYRVERNYHRQFRDAPVATQACVDQINRMVHVLTKCTTFNFKSFVSIFHQRTHKLVKDPIAGQALMDIFYELSFRLHDQEYYEEPSEASPERLSLLKAWMRQVVLDDAARPLPVPHTKADHECPFDLTYKSSQQRLEIIVLNRHCKTIFGSDSAPPNFGRDDWWVWDRHKLLIQVPFRGGKQQVIDYLEEHDRYFIHNRELLSGHEINQVMATAFANRKKD